MLRHLLHAWIVGWDFTRLQLARPQILRVFSVGPAHSHQAMPCRPAKSAVAEHIYRESGAHHRMPASSAKQGPSLVRAPPTAPDALPVLILSVQQAGVLASSVPLDCSRRPPGLKLQLSAHPALQEHMPSQMGPALAHCVYVESTQIKQPHRVSIVMLESLLH